jgi:hypothetical protein
MINSLVIVMVVVHVAVVAVVVQRALKTGQLTTMRSLLLRGMKAM